MPIVLTVKLDRSIEDAMALQLSSAIETLRGVRSVRSDFAVSSASEEVQPGEIEKEPLLRLAPDNLTTRRARYECRIGAMINGEPRVLNGEITQSMIDFDCDYFDPRIQAIVNKIEPSSSELQDSVTSPATHDDNPRFLIVFMEDDVPDRERDNAVAVIRLLQGVVSVDMGENARGFEVVLSGKDAGADDEHCAEMSLEHRLLFHFHQMSDRQREIMLRLMQRTAHTKFPDDLGSDLKRAILDVMADLDTDFFDSRIQALLAVNHP